MKYDSITIGFIESDFGDEEIYVAPVVDGKKSHLYFKNKYEAIICAGLQESGLSANDISHMSGYICAMIDGVKNQK